MKLKDLITRLQIFERFQGGDTEILIATSDGETGAQMHEHIDVRRVYDNEHFTTSGQRAVIVLRMKEYGEEEFEFVPDQERS